MAARGTTRAVASQDFPIINSCIFRLAQSQQKFFSTFRVDVTVEPSPQPSSFIRNYDIKFRQKL